MEGGSPALALELIAMNGHPYVCDAVVEQLPAAFGRKMSLGLHFAGCGLAPQQRGFVRPVHGAFQVPFAFLGANPLDKRMKMDSSMLA